MTAYSQTVSASVNVLGASPTDLWNAYNWNAFLWGAGTATIPKNFTHLLAGQAVTPSAANDFRFTHLLAAQSVGSTAAVGLRVYVLLSAQSIGSTDLIAHLYLKDPQGYFHVFPEGVTDGTLITTPSWAALSATAASWTKQTVTTTTWS